MLWVKEIFPKKQFHFINTLLSYYELPIYDQIMTADFLKPPAIVNDSLLEKVGAKILDFPFLCFLCCKELVIWSFHALPLRVCNHKHLKKAPKNLSPHNKNIPHATKNLLGGRNQTTFFKDAPKNSPPRATKKPPRGGCNHTTFFQKRSQKISPPATKNLPPWGGEI